MYISCVPNFCFELFRSCINGRRFSSSWWATRLWWRWQTRSWFWCRSIIQLTTLLLSLGEIVVETTSRGYGMMYSLFPTASLFSAHADACRWRRGAEVQVGRHEEIASWGGGRSRLFVAETGCFEECLSRCLCGFIQGSWYAVEGSEAQDAAQCTVAAPSSCGCDGDHASHVVLVVVDVQA